MAKRNRLVLLYAMLALVYSASGTLVPPIAGDFVYYTDPVDIATQLISQAPNVTGLFTNLDEYSHSNFTETNSESTRRQDNGEFGFAKGVNTVANVLKRADDLIYNVIHGIDTNSPPFVDPSFNFVRSFIPIEISDSHPERSLLATIKADGSDLVPIIQSVYDRIAAGLQLAGLPVVTVASPGTTIEVCRDMLCEKHVTNSILPLDIAYTIYTGVIVPVTLDDVNRGTWKSTKFSASIGSTGIIKAVSVYGVAFGTVKRESLGELGVDWDVHVGGSPGGPITVSGGLSGHFEFYQAPTLPLYNLMTKAVVDKKGPEALYTYTGGFKLATSIGINETKTALLTQSNVAFIRNGYHDGQTVGNAVGFTVTSHLATTPFYRWAVELLKNAAQAQGNTFITLTITDVDAVFSSSSTREAHGYAQ